MERKEISKKSGEIFTEKGQWELAKGEGGLTALLSCPGCGKVCSLSDHEIAPDGKVSPSLVCPHGCGYHSHVKLVGWPE